MEKTLEQLSKEELKELQSIVVTEKVKQADEHTLHTNWVNWYKNRKVVTKKNSREYLNTMVFGMAEDFYLVLEQKNKEIEELKLKLKDGKANITFEPLKEFNDEQTVTD